MNYAEINMTPSSVESESVETINVVFISSDGTPQVRSFASTPLGQEMAKEEARLILNSIRDTEISDYDLERIVNDGSIDINDATLFYVFSEEPSLANEVLKNDTASILSYSEQDITINGVKIHERVFDEELVDYKVEYVPDFKTSLETWISEADKDGNDIVLMRSDLRYMQGIDDDYIFSSFSTNEYIVPSLEPIKFKEMCTEIIARSDECMQEDAEAENPLFIALKEEDCNKIIGVIADECLLDNEVCDYIKAIKNEGLREEFENFYNDKYRDEGRKLYLERTIINGNSKKDIAEEVIKYDIDIFVLEISQEDRQKLNNICIELIKEDSVRTSKPKSLKP